LSKGITSMVCQHWAFHWLPWHHSKWYYTSRCSLSYRAQS